MSTKKIGVLDLQGAVREHIKMINELSAQGIPIKNPNELSGVQALIIPGGESTAIGKLMVKYNFVEPVKEMASKGFPIYGTCAGLILLAKRIVGNSQPLLELMDIEVKRNAFGRQKESFETELDIYALGEEKYPGVFIRAPWIESVGENVEVLAVYNKKTVMAREKNFLVTAFHPELTNDFRIHKYFIDMIK
ncbi:MAG: pyridoxal 5'-phosphate synthase glutaminase subunit PdxT [Actinobacteria bacterium]|nr:pyridoxal 5'-phosphate synthase glutaminase subunit PdxT [Actinomycetota bacterium]